MFLINSHYPLLSATPVRSESKSLHGSRPTFSRSYGGNLLSSLGSVLSSALVCSTRLPESVCGTVTETTRYEDFLGSMGSATLPSPWLGLVLPLGVDESTGLPMLSTYGISPGALRPSPGRPTLLRPPFADNAYSVVQEY